MDDVQRGLIEKHLNLVFEANKTMNLTRIADIGEGWLLHVEDSLSALPEMEHAPDGRYGDLGSGGGYPGIPLAIVSNRETVLIEARKKKADALESMINELELQDAVSVFCGRAELLARSEPESFAVLTARALAKLSVLMELASPLLQQDGILICYKAHVDDEERNNARRVQEHTGMVFETERPFLLGNDSIERNIIVFRKAHKAIAKLPRKEGMAQKHPL